MKILTLLFLISQAVFSQTFPYYHYTSDDGLPSLTAYDILQDKNGYIWIATNNGLCRFDGNRFNRLGLKDGLNSRHIVSILEGENNEIYIGNYDKGINLYKEGNITALVPPEIDLHLYGDLFLENNKLYSQSSNGFLFYYRNRNIEDTAALSYGEYSGIYTTITNRIEKISNGRFWALTTDGIYEFIDNNFRKIDINNFSDPDVYSVTEDKNGSLFVGGVGSIYIIKDYKLIKTIKTGNFDDKIFRIFYDSQGNIWYSVLNKGFRIIYAGSDKSIDIGIKLKIPKAVVNKIMEDNEGNIWVSTFGKGVFCLNNMYIKNYNEDDGLSNNNVQAFEKDRFGRLIIGTFNGINILENGKFYVYNFGVKNMTDYVYEFNYLNNKIYTCVSSENLNINKKYFINKVEFVFLSTPSFCITKDSVYLSGAWGNNYFKSNEFSRIYENYYYVMGEVPKNNRVNKIFEDSKGNLWFGTALGLCKIKNGMKEYFYDNEILNSAINSIKEDINNKVWFAGEKGVAYYDLKTSEVTSLPDNNKYDFSTSTSIEFDKYNRIWVGNTKGLYVLDNNSVKYFNKLTGLPSNDILSLFYDKEKNIMWVGTNYGFSSFDLNIFDNYKQLPLIIAVNYIKSGDSTYTSYDNLVFEQNNNNIYVSFSAMNFSSPSTMAYQYRLGEKWIDNENDFLDFGSMKEGTYNLYIRAKTQNSDWCRPVFLPFTVKPKFAETIWFQIISISFLTVIILFGSFLKIKATKKKNLEKLQITNRFNELEHRAISALMNPHFIFNALSSIQYLVNLNKRKEANDYISLMAKLFRKNLDLATERFIKLDEEIERLKLYLDIEKLRFGEKFSYDFLVCEQIDSSKILIPNMIIQPFVENAVIHGILPKSGSGYVNIAFDLENFEINHSEYKCLVIRITDNGVGVAKSSKFRRPGHTSRAINIIKERLILLSRELNLPNPIIITDLGERISGSCGTEVILTLPPALYKYIAN
ncbi:MAG: hypothetical protein EHM58_00345 [Ignavibacteriae bacterium]|nr:MAG: hypothetical protein EHM58_00345 [Ignavibacteriota bacterium]